MPNPIQISVIIPTYRPGAYLWTCLDSLCRQMMPAERFEMIIVLNGCNEPYTTEIAQYISAHPHHRFVVRQTDTAGVSHARNIGLDLCAGKYVAMVDDDDWLSPDYLALLWQKAAENSIVVTDVQLIDDVTGQERAYYLHDAFQTTFAKRPTFFTARSFFSTAWGKLIPMGVIAGDRFDTRFRLGEDALFMFAIARRVQTICATSPAAVYYVRERSGSASRSPLDYFSRAGILLRLACAYTTIWARHPRQYHFPFFVSRIVATLAKLVLIRYR